MVMATAAVCWPPQPGMLGKALGLGDNNTEHGRAPKQPGPPAWASFPCEKNNLFGSDTGAKCSSLLTNRTHPLLVLTPVNPSPLSGPLLPTPL